MLGIGEVQNCTGDGLKTGNASRICLAVALRLRVQSLAQSQVWVMNQSSSCNLWTGCQRAACTCYRGPPTSGQRVPLVKEHFLRYANFAADEVLCESLARLAQAYEYQKNQVVISQSSEGYCLYLVLQGQVRVNTLAASGRHVTFQLLSAGELFGELSAIDAERRLASVTTEVPTLVAMLRRQDFFALLDAHPFFVKHLLVHLVRRSRWLATKVFEYHALDVSGRIYAELLREAARSTSSPPTLDIADRDMASRVGTTRENVTRIYGRLRKLGIVERNTKQLKLLDLVRLQELLAQSEFN